MRVIFSCILIMFTLAMTASAYAQGGDTPPNPIGSKCEERGCFDSPTWGRICIYFPCGENKVVEYRPRSEEGIGAEHKVEGPDGDDCVGCVVSQCEDAKRIIRENHETYERAVMREFSYELEKHRKWLRDEFFQKHILKALMHMTEQMSAVSMHQTVMFGQFIDAKAQMETQRTLQELQAAAHRDYQPSEDFCWFGTNVRSLADADEKQRYNAEALGAAQLSRHLGTVNTAGAQSEDQDKASRWEHFTKTYCDPKDNNWTRPDTGLSLACKTEIPLDPQRVNIDIDYTRLIDQPRTLNVDFTNRVAATGPVPERFQTEANEADEEDVLAMSYNLYGHDVLSRKLAPHILNRQEYQHLYLALRSIAAKRSVAEHSYDSIIAIKAKASDEMSGGQQTPNTQKFLEAVLAELGVSNQPGQNGGRSEAEKMLGTNPSYYAQLEVLAKMIYQNPDFYANLYDKPANIERKSAALLAIERMLDQALLESQLRQEMSMSVLLSTRMAQEVRETNRALARPNEINR